MRIHIGDFLIGVMAGGLIFYGLIMMEFWVLGP